MSKAKSPRAAEDIIQLQRAIDACAGDEDELMTFKEWRKQVLAGTLAELGTARRAFLRNFLIAAEDAGVMLARPRPAKVIPAPAESGVILCGPLPLAPPGVQGNARRHGAR